MEDKLPTVHILASNRNATLYIGVTGNLNQRIWQHRNDVVDAFSKKYRTHKLVYFGQHASMADAILREKQIKKWNRAWKLELTEKSNPSGTISTPRSRKSSAKTLDSRFRGNDEVNR